jgi:peptidoglycan/LPS O-acetylase OafA/YrhL
VEEHFYAVAPLFLLGLGALRSHRTRIGLLLALWIAGLAVRFRSAADIPVMTVGSELFGSMREIYFTSHNRFDILVAGILLAYLHHHFSDRLAALFARAPARWSAYAVSLGCLALLVFKPRLFGMDDMTFVLLSFGTLTSLMYVPLILVLISTDGPLVRFLSRPIFLRIATLGYGIYLVHMPVCTRLIPLTRRILSDTAAPFPLVWSALLAATLLLSAAVAYLLHLLVEKPSLRLRDRLAPRRSV